MEARRWLQLEEHERSLARDHGCRHTFVNLELLALSRLVITG